MSIKWLSTGLTTEIGRGKGKALCEAIFNTKKIQLFSFAPLVYAEACGLREKSTCPLSAVKNPRNPQQELT